MFELKNHLRITNPKAYEVGLFTTVYLQFILDAINAGKSLDEIFHECEESYRQAELSSAKDYFEYSIHGHRASEDPEKYDDVPDSLNNRLFNSNETFENILNSLR